jgi:hypothetical protein
LSSAPPAPAVATSNAPSVPPPKQQQHPSPGSPHKLPPACFCLLQANTPRHHPQPKSRASIHPSRFRPFPIRRHVFVFLVNVGRFYTGMPLSVVSSLLFLPRLLCLTGSLGRRFAFASFGPLVRLRSVCVCMIPSSSLVALLYITEGRKKIIIKSPNKKDDVQEQEASSRLILPTCEHEK